jgi:hypothetical protein
MKYKLKIAESQARSHMRQQVCHLHATRRFDIHQIGVTLDVGYSMDILGSRTLLMWQNACFHTVKTAHFYDVILTYLFDRKCK